MRQKCKIIELGLLGDGPVTKALARQCVALDMARVGAVFDFLEQCGWINNSPMLDALRSDFQKDALAAAAAAAAASAAAAGGTGTSTTTTTMSTSSTTTMQ